jgi:hypothetical protein
MMSVAGNVRLSGVEAAMADDLWKISGVDSNSLILSKKVAVLNVTVDGYKVVGMTNASRLLSSRYSKNLFVVPTRGSGDVLPVRILQYGVPIDDHLSELGITERVSP